MSTNSRPSNTLDHADLETAEGEPISQAPEAGGHRVSLLVFARDDVRVVEMQDGESIVVGRTAPAELRVDDAKLSRSHARFTRKGDVVSVEDLGSRNGTWLDGQRVQTARLSSGSTVLLGSSQATVHVASRLSAMVAGIESHDRWLSRLDQELARARSFRRSLSVLMLRTRSPKDASSSGLCLELRGKLRAVDVIGTYGAGALLILAPETTPGAALSLAKTLASSSDEPEKRSIGVATYPDHAASAQELLSEAMRSCLRATPDEPVVTPKAVRAEAATKASSSVAGVYESAKMREVCAQLQRLAPRNLPVLILGETGTGKELAARMLHDESPRKSGPLRVVNCGAIPENLITSTLFGHERGAFTGADRSREGVFEDARGGTVFLDEVGELSPAAQAALLRALETRKITRVGGNREIDIDARFVAATHRDLDAMASSGEFRLDLLHRLNAVTVSLPPLRERREDIPPLVRFFLEQAKREWRSSVSHVDPAALALLEAHSWPGNLRELRNVVSRAVALVEGDTITVQELPENVRQDRPTTATRATERPPSAGLDLRAHLRDVERDLIFGALERSGGNQRKAAEQLGMPLRTFERRLAAVKDGSDG